MGAAMVNWEMVVGKVDDHAGWYPAPGDFDTRVQCSSYRGETYNGR